MTAERIALTRRMITRGLAFIGTLILGLGLGQIFPLHDGGNAEITPVKQYSGCPRMHR
jgi:hypothetical protein